MVSSLEDISHKYEEQYGDQVRSQDRLRDIYESYVRRRESTLLDSATATAAIHALFFADEIDFGAITPQMSESFDRAYPGQDLAQRLEELKKLDPNSAEVTGFLSNWKGVYHEVLIVDKLNNGDQVDSIVLGEGQKAILSPHTNQPGVDIKILNLDGTEDLDLQAKAVKSVDSLKTALAKYPDTQILATDEAATRYADERVFSSGFNNESLQSQVEAPMEEVWGGPIEEFIENVLPGLPFVIIATTEGARVLMGRQAFQNALNRSVQRGIKTGTSVGVGALAALAGAGLFSLPATFLTRLAVDRYWLHGRLIKKVDYDTGALKALAT